MDKYVVMQKGFAYITLPSLSIAAAHKAHRNKTFDIQFVEYPLGLQFALISNPQDIPFDLRYNYCATVTRYIRYGIIRLIVHKGILSGDIDTQTNNRVSITYTAIDFDSQEITQSKNRPCE